MAALMFLLLACYVAILVTGNASLWNIGSFVIWGSCNHTVWTLITVLFDLPTNIYNLYSHIPLILVAVFLCARSSAIIFVFARFQCICYMSLLFLLIILYSNLSIVYHIIPYCVIVFLHFYILTFVIVLFPQFFYVTVLQIDTYTYIYVFVYAYCFT